MADVRALLRAERAAREPATKPRKHTQSLPLQQVSIHNKKRKSPDLEDGLGEDEARKRAREDREVPGSVKSGKMVTFADEELIAEEQEAVVIEEEGDHVGSADIDEDEWAAFERDVATPPPETQPAPTKQTALSALNSSTAISAAPTTVANGVNQSEEQKRKEEQKAQRERREEEVAAEKEDATRNLEDEFEEMDALEERVRRLKERREMLRSGMIGSRHGGDEEMVEHNAEDEGVEDEDESGSDEDDDDLWAFGKR